jgi:PadR family transcriptional regulator PadR
LDARIEKYQKKLEREMKSGLVSLLVLSIIKKSRDPIYGYGIITGLKKATGGDLILKEGSVYPILHYLQTQKFVVSYLDESPTGAPRKYYTITKSGERAFEKGLQSWTRLKNILDIVLSDTEVK